ncbi:MAG: hypothetical protein SFV21_04060 [Rhodospirillaceae bacterium]|nr:hypothetical protein [Rhodospirillaceae bacterium]
MDKSVFRRPWIALLCALAAGFATGDSNAQDSLPQAKPLSAERLTMPLFPNGWAAAATTRGNIELIDYLPDGQTLADWRDRITLEVYHELNTLPLDALYRRAQAQARSQCDGVIEGRFQSGVNNGYPSAFWTIGCKRDLTTGLGETRYTKAIQGDGRVYVLTRAWRTPAYGDEGPAIAPRAIEDAVAFLSTSIACNDGDAQRACPKPP